MNSIVESLTISQINQLSMMLLSPVHRRNE